MGPREGSVQGGVRPPQALGGRACLLSAALVGPSVAGSPTPGPAARSGDHEEDDAGVRACTLDKGVAVSAVVPHWMLLWGRTPTQLGWEWGLSHWAQLLAGAPFGGGVNGAVTWGREPAAARPCLGSAPQPGCRLAPWVPAGPSPLPPRNLPLSPPRFSISWAQHLSGCILAESWYLLPGVIFWAQVTGELALDLLGAGVTSPAPGSVHLGHCEPHVYNQAL